MNKWDAIIDQIVKREKKAPVIIIQGPRAGRGRRFLGEDRLNAKKPIAIGTWRRCSSSCGSVERRVPPDAGPRRAQPGERAARASATSGRTRRPSPATTPTARSTRLARLLTAVSAPQADEIEKMKMELLRLRFDEQVRSEKRKSRRHR